MALPNGNMEIVFSFDTTGSMYSYLDEVRGRVSDMVQRLQADIPGIKMAIFAHGDYCDRSTYITKYVDLTDDVAKLVDFVQNVERTGGGDADECYELVLHEVRTKLSWTPGTQRALVMIGDCNPHEPNYPQNTMKLNWRNEADSLAKIGVRIYSVQCGGSTDLHFYSDIAKRTQGKHLKLGDFKNLFDFLMTVCYREKGDDLFDTYEKEVRGRCGPIHKDLDQLFGDLRDKAPSSSTSDSGLTSASVSTKPVVKETKLVKLTKAKIPKATAKLVTKRFKTRVTKTGKAGVKNVVKTLPRLRREMVPEINFMLRDLKWSPWEHIISPAQNEGDDITRRRRGGHGYRSQQLFNGKTKVPALYEVAVQTKFRGRKNVLYSKLCRRGFASIGNWERKFFGKPALRAQVDRVVDKSCHVFIRRVVLKGAKTLDLVKESISNYDYAWKGIRSVRKDHRQVTKGTIDISEPMDM